MNSINILPLKKVGIIIAILNALAVINSSNDEFSIWLNTPNRALDNRLPFSLLDTSFGISLVLDILGRIEHGIVS